MIKTGLGQDSHRFDFDKVSNQQLRLGGLVFEEDPPLKGNSDADVVLHAVTNAVSGITGVNILGSVSDEMCEKGIRDSREYLKEALKHLGDYFINHVSISIECLRPVLSPRIDEMKDSLAGLLDIKKEQVGITATSGEGLTEFGKGNGVQALVVITAVHKEFAGKISQ